MTNVSLAEVCRIFWYAIKPKESISPQLRALVESGEWTYSLKGFRPATLYERLQQIDSSIGDVKCGIEGIESLTKLGVKMDVSLQVPDATAARKNVIEKYKHNPILQAAIEGSQSIEETVLELDRDLKSGIRRFRFFPRRKKQAYNEKVAELCELTGEEAVYLRRQGIFSRDNFVMRLSSNLAGTGMASGALYFLSPDVAYAFGALTGGVSLSWASLELAYSRKTGEMERITEIARYIDEKINHTAGAEK